MLCKACFYSVSTLWRAAVFRFVGEQRVGIQASALALVCAIFILNENILNGNITYDNAGWIIYYFKKM